MRLLHLMVWANGLLNQLVYSAFHSEGTSQSKEWLLQELNGVHLRLSAPINVCSEIDKKYIYIQYLMK